MRLMIICIAVLTAAPAMAHIGHVGELAGHDHWVAGAALGVAAAVTLWAALKGKKTQDSENNEVEEDEADEPEEATA